MAWYDHRPAKHADRREHVPDDGTRFSAEHAGREREGGEREEGERGRRERERERERSRIHETVLRNVWWTLRLFWSSFLIVEKTVRVLFGETTSGEAGRNKKRRGHVGGHKGIGVGGGGSEWVCMIGMIRANTLPPTFHPNTCSTHSCVVPTCTPHMYGHDCCVCVCGALVICRPVSGGAFIHC